VNVEGEGEVLGVNVRRPIVANGDFVASLCGSAYSGIAIELSFGTVSGVGAGIHVLNGSPRASSRRGCFWHGIWHFLDLCPHSFEWAK